MNNDNTGYWNTGNRNTGDCNTGYFNTNTPKTVRVFNKEVSREDFDRWPKPDWLFFNLTEWVSEEVMTDEEKEEHAGYKKVGGYLKVNDYKKELQKSYANATREEQLGITKCPGFDAELFFEISGIRVHEESVEEMTLEDVCRELGREVNIIRND